MKVKKYYLKNDLNQGLCCEVSSGNFAWVEIENWENFTKFSSKKQARQFTKGTPIMYKTIGVIKIKIKTTQKI